MNQYVVWLNQLHWAEYELKTCQEILNLQTDLGLQGVMEQIECTSRHLANLALEIKMRLREKQE